MPCADIHALVNLLGGTALCAAAHDDGKGHGLPHPVTSGVLTAFLAGLPDLIEPAHHPHHRQLFHSVAFAGLLGAGIYKAYHWRAETDLQAFARAAALVVGTAYLLHLLADAFTSRSLPLLGKAS